MCIAYCDIRLTSRVIAVVRDNVDVRGSDRASGGAYGYAWCRPAAILPAHGCAFHRGDRDDRDRATGCECYS